MAIPKRKQHNLNGGLAMSNETEPLMLVPSVGMYPNRPNATSVLRDLDWLEQYKEHQKYEEMRRKAVNEGLSEQDKEQLLQPLDASPYRDPQMA